MNSIGKAPSAAVKNHNNVEREEPKMSKKLPVGIQVYGLRDLLENTPENFKNVMQQVKDLGYDGVELAGLYGLTPEYVKVR